MLEKRRAAFPAARLSQPGKTPFRAFVQTTFSYGGPGHLQHRIEALVSVSPVPHTAELFRKTLLLLVIEAYVERLRGVSERLAIN